MRPVDFVKWLYPHAKKVDIDTIFVIAQAALESGWGKSAIGNNIFGITKGSTWNGRTKLITTTEYFSNPDIKFNEPEKILNILEINSKRYKYTVKRLFRDYLSVQECLKDHSLILQKPQFKDAWIYRHDRYEFVKRIVDNVGGKYATDPSYVKTMNSLFESVNRIIVKEKLV